MRKLVEALFATCTLSEGIGFEGISTCSVWFSSVLYAKARKLFFYTRTYFAPPVKLEVGFSLRFLFFSSLLSFWVLSFASFPFASDRSSVAFSFVALERSLDRDLPSLAFALPSKEACPACSAELQLATGAGSHGAVSICFV